VAATTFLSGAGADQQERASRARQRHLRSWRFQIFVLMATVAAGLLAYLGKTVGQLPLDLELTRWIQDLSAPGLGAFLHAVSWVGYPPQSNVIWGAVIVLLFLVGWRLESFGFLMAAAGSAILWLIIVPLVDRPRPSPELVRVATELPTGSFPSGHVLNLTAIFGFLIFIATQKIENAVLRRTIEVLLAVPILTVGVARVYDGAHWPSDVLGGYLIGGIWLALSIGLYQELHCWLEHRRERQREQA
jgi:membrane-associated phospholipid phosphatase